MFEDELEPPTLDEIMAADLPTSVRVSALKGLTDGQISQRFGLSAEELEVFRRDIEEGRLQRAMHGQGIRDRAYFEASGRLSAVRHDKKRTKNSGD